MSAFENADAIATETHVPKIVITGGPCSGKTTGMTMLQNTLKGLGYRVFIAPEAATMYFLAGVEFGDLGNPALSIAFQKTVLNAQLHCENSLERYALATGQKSIILCDRGAMDGLAYMEDDAFDEVLADGKLNRTTASATRYAAVFHLVTAADGAPSFYTLENNETRTESVDFAKVIDKKTQAAWSGHPHHFIIDNSGRSFQDKMDKLISTMLHAIGQSHSPSTSSGDSSSAGLSSTGVYHFELSACVHSAVMGLGGVKMFNVEKCVLTMPDGCAAPGPIAALLSHSHHREGAPPDLSRVELHRQYPTDSGALSEEDSKKLSMYMLVHISHSGETKRIVSAREYEVLRAFSLCPAAQQKRYCFIWNNQVMNLFQHFQEATSDEWSWTLTVYSASGDPTFPDFLADTIINPVK